MRQQQNKFFTILVKEIVGKQSAHLNSSDEQRFLKTYFKGRMGILWEKLIK